MEKVTVQLRTPVQAHGEEISSIALRPPKGADIVACGYPFHIGGDEASPVMIPQAGVIARYIARLGSVPPSTVGQLDPRDFNDLLGVVGRFFGDGTETSRTETASG